MKEEILFNICIIMFGLGIFSFVLGGFPGGEQDAISLLAIGIGLPVTIFGIKDLRNAIGDNSELNDGNTA